MLNGVKFFSFYQSVWSFRYSSRTSQPRGYISTFAGYGHVQNDKPLVYVTGKGHLLIVRELLNNGANIHVSIYLPLTVAATNDHLAVVQDPEKRVNRGADINLLNTELRSKYIISRVLLLKNTIN